MYPYRQPKIRNEEKQVWEAIAQTHKCKGICTTCVKWFREFMAALVYARYCEGSKGVDRLLEKRQKEIKKGVPFHKRTKFMKDLKD